VGDIDADGDLDVVIANADGGTLALYEQYSPTVIGSRPIATLGSPATLSQVSAVEIADLDGDGRADLCTANVGTGTLALFFQGTGGTFSPTPDLVLGGLSGPVAVAIADLDADGDLDLASANEGDDNLRVFLQSAPRSFAPPGTALGSAATTNAPLALVAADLDGDGDQDLACANGDGSTISVFLQGVAGAFPTIPSAVIGSAAVIPNPGALVACDVDGDGDLDLACASRIGDSVRFFRQDSPGAFEAAPAATVSHAALDRPTSLALSDVDQDGDLDLVASGETSENVCLFRQRRPWDFATAPDVCGTPGALGAPRSLRAVDFDGDGEADLLVARPDLDSVAIFYNSH
jgi:hypothetical protein